MPVSKPKLASELSTVREEAGDQDVVADVWASSKAREDQTRQEVARKFVRYYFLILLIIIVGVPVYNYFIYNLTGDGKLFIDLKDAVLTYSAVVGPTMGLVVAYYFRTEKSGE